MYAAASLRPSGRGGPSGGGGPRGGGGPSGGRGGGRGPSGGRGGRGRGHRQVPQDAHQYVHEFLAQEGDSEYTKLYHLECRKEEELRAQRAWQLHIQQVQWDFLDKPFLCDESAFKILKAAPKFSRLGAWARAQQRHFLAPKEVVIGRLGRKISAPFNVSAAEGYDYPCLIPVLAYPILESTRSTAEATRLAMRHGCTLLTANQTFIEELLVPVQVRLDYFFCLRKEAVPEDVAIMPTIATITSADDLPQLLRNLP